MRPLHIPPPPPRPMGSGAFWDYAAASSRQQDQRTARVRYTDNLKFALRAAEVEEAEERWANEGGRP